MREWDAARLEPRTFWRGENCVVQHVLHAAGWWGFMVTQKGDVGEVGGDEILLSRVPGREPLTSMPRTWQLLRAAALSRDAKRIAVLHGTTPSVVEIADVASGRVLAEAASHNGGSGYALAWSPDGRFVILTEKGGFSFRDSSDLREIGWLPSPYPSDLCFAPDGALLALGDWSKGLVAPWPALMGEVANGRPVA
jgi:hypothetical protein